jgi:hypothetical protein
MSLQRAPIATCHRRRFFSDASLAMQNDGIEGPFGFR